MTDTINRISLKHCLSVNILVVLPIVICCGFTKLKHLFQHINNDRKLCLVHKKDIYFMMIDIIPWFSYNSVVKKILLFLIPFVATANSSILTSIPTPIYHFPSKTSFDIQREVQPDFQNKIPSVTLDSHYIGVKYDYFLEFNKWYTKQTKGVSNDKNNESFDCDNHAMLYKSLFSIGTLKNDFKREIMVGVILVEQTEKYLGIPPTRRHALNIIFTDKGWIVYEPQTNLMCNLKEYPLSIKAFVF